MLFSESNDNANEQLISSHYQYYYNESKPGKRSACHLILHTQTSSRLFDSKFIWDMQEGMLFICTTGKKFGIIKILKCNLLLWSKLNFQHHYFNLQCHMIFRNHSNMLICCSRNISDYYDCWKQLLLLNIFMKPWFMSILFEIKIFCNIINVFTVTFDQFNATQQKY